MYVQFFSLVSLFELQIISSLKFIFWWKDKNTEALKTRDMKTFLFGYIPTPSSFRFVSDAMYLFSKSYQFTRKRRKQENKDLVVDIIVVFSIYHIILE